MMTGAVLLLTLLQVYAGNGLPYHRHGSRAGTADGVHILDIVNSRIGGDQIRYIINSLVTTIEKAGQSTSSADSAPIFLPLISSTTTERCAKSQTAVTSLGPALHSNSTLSSSLHTSRPSFPVRITSSSLEGTIALPTSRCKIEALSYDKTKSSTLQRKVAVSTSRGRTRISRTDSQPTLTSSQSQPAHSPSQSKRSDPGSMSNIFVPVSTGPPAAVLGSRPDHPAPRQGIVYQSAPIPTNKFYANFFLGNQNQGTWTHPYSVTWIKGTGNSQSWGIGVSHVDPFMRAFGPDPNVNPVQYFINPIGIHSIILSASELGTTTVISMDTLKAFSANLNLHRRPGEPAGITFPLVQGMGFVTGLYRGLAPVIQSIVLFKSVVRVPWSSQAGAVKYRIVLEDGNTWLLYATASSGSALSLQQISNGRLRATGTFTGSIQVAKNPGGSVIGEQVYDICAGAYAIAASISGSISGGRGAYTLQWTKSGVTSSPLMMFALPHHVESFDTMTGQRKTNVQLATTTKGLATLIVSDSWTLVESDLPLDIGFAPWSPISRGARSISASALQAIQSAAASEVLQDMSAQSNLDSMYFSGKALSKFATVVYVLHDIVKNQPLAKFGLNKLKAAFAVFTNNSQKYPLVYETAWRGVVSTASYVTRDPVQDFGNSYYNDHHFHYGYFIHAAAIIGYLDPSWLAANKDWVNTLVRDVANPSELDSYFPFSRSFDWYHGHSWAKGLFESADGKDEESSSEDAFFAYAVKMWGRTLGDSSMEARGNLMLAIVARSLRNYFMLESTNKNQPGNFIGNKVPGILFENKADHTTYFSNAIECIQGIHMLPINPSSGYTRRQIFVWEEWATYFNNGRVDQINSGWKGILYSNLALIDPVSAWKFFSQPNFQTQWLDGGASLAWYLAYSAGLGGAP